MDRGGDTSSKCWPSVYSASVCVCVSDINRAGSCCCFNASVDVAADFSCYHHHESDSWLGEALNRSPIRVKRSLDLSQQRNFVFLLKLLRSDWSKVLERSNIFFFFKKNGRGGIVLQGDFTSVSLGKQDDQKRVKQWPKPCQRGGYCYSYISVVKRSGTSVPSWHNLM